MRWQLVESDAALAEVLALARSCDTVVLDTEFMRRDTFFPHVALLQLCFTADGTEPDFAWLVDPLAIAETGALADLLTDPGITKVLHSASEDLEVFQHWLGALPQPLFDTQRAAALVDLGFGLGYRSLVKAVSGIEVDKGETRSNWLQRPLTDSQCEYAAMDVICLYPVWRELQRRCVAADKLDWVLADGADMVAVAERGPVNFHARVKGAWKLRPRQLAALDGLCQWREATARDRDRPRNWILDDRACLEVARRLPASNAELAACTDVPPAVVRRYGGALLDVLTQAAALPEDAWPRPLPEPLGTAQRNEVKRLKSRVRDIAGDLEVAPEVLLQSADYELLLREGAGEAFEPPAHWQGWRRDLVFAPLRRGLAGERA